MRGNAWIQRRIGRFEDHGQQAADHLGEARIGILDGHGSVADVPAQRGQLIQAEQGEGDAVEQARAAAALRAVGGFAVQELACLRLDAFGVLA